MQGLISVLNLLEKYIIPSSSYLLLCSMFYFPQSEFPSLVLLIVLLYNQKISIEYWHKATAQLFSLLLFTVSNSWMDFQNVYLSFILFYSCYKTSPFFL